jgi:hypothetical protein
VLPRRRYHLLIDDITPEVDLEIATTLIPEDHMADRRKRCRKERQAAVLQSGPETVDKDAGRSKPGKLDDG